MLLFLVFVAFVFGRCPAQCSGHGQCVANRCRCDEGFAGNDCSIVDSELDPSSPATGSVGFRKWQYYHYEVMTPGQEATFIMHETNTGISVHDCDLYLRLDDYPTTRSYFSKNATVGKDASLMVRSSDPRGTWYVGVFGYLGCSFSLSLSMPTNACPNGCSGNGTCSDDGVCICAAGFGGQSCLAINRTLTLNSPPVSGHVNMASWVYYFFDLTETKDRIVINLTSPNDTDLYVRKDAFPTLFLMNFSNTSVPLQGQPDEASVVLQSPEVGRWYVGVYGFHSSDFQLAAISEQFSTTCPNNCSLSHGSCNGGRCSCYQGFHGDVCGFQDDDLVEGQYSSGFVDAGQWNFFTFSPDSSSDINITAFMNTSLTPKGDCDLYLKASGFPNRSSFDAADMGFSSSMKLILASPGNQRYYLGVFGWKACAFNITYNQVVASGDDCGVHGAPGDGVGCICEDGWYGELCNVQPILLISNAQTVSGTVVTGSWVYYSLTANATSFTVTAQEMSSSGGFLGLYAQVEGLPTLTDNFSKDETDQQIHFVHLEFDSPSSRTVLIGVFANGYGGEGSSHSFKIAGFAF